MRQHGRTIELSLYSVIHKIFEEHNAKPVSQVKFVTVPDFIINWLGERWIVSIKIGNPTRAKDLKDAFLQYISHMKDSGIEYGMIIFYPEEVRKVIPSYENIEKIVRYTEVYIIVLNPQMELRKPLSEALDEIEKALREKIPVSFSPSTVISLLRAHIEELMDKVGIKDSHIMKMISDPKLFFGINPVVKDEKKKQGVLRKASAFIAAYIFLSQALFLRLYCQKRPTYLEGIDINNIKRDDARRLFEKIKNINYRPIFEIDVLDAVPEDLIRDTFKLLFGLQIENIRYELPGRLFHELMPREVRKLLAAFYTRPIAAYLLAQLTIDNAEATIFDPACGSGTILTMAYRRKLELWQRSKRFENPHKLFCEEHIFGCDIMPFAVHLTNANLVAMNPLTTINLTQIALGDSLKLAPSARIRPGFLTLIDFYPELSKEKFKVKANAFKRTGETVEITLKPMDVILMNPPFTKIERGIKKYMETSKYEKDIGREVGLWGHFVALADVFLKDDGMFGAVLPINVLRGRESAKVREIIFKDWLPLYIIKASKNYGFTEYAEYRDVLVIARKTIKKNKNHRVKFCIIKKDLNKLTEDEALWIAEQVKRIDSLRSKLLDIDSYQLSEVHKHFNNMMPFISGSSLEDKDALRRIIEEAEKLFFYFPQNYFKEGYGPRPKGVSKFMFITRPIGEGRIQEAFLVLEKELRNEVIAKTPSGVQYFKFTKSHFLPSLRTPVGLDMMDVTQIHDYVSKEPYEEIERVMALCNFKKKLPKNYWSGYIKNEFRRAKGNVAIIRRINPYSPNQKLIAYYSNAPLILANLFHVIDESNVNRAKAVTVLLNSIFFMVYFFNIKEETTGRYTELRHYDLYDMKLYPLGDNITRQLAKVFEKYKRKRFPALREQLDIYFDERYEWFWRHERKNQKTQIQPPPIEPHPLRLNFDIDIIKAIGANLSMKDLRKAYEAIVWDMIITRGLRRD